MNAKKLIRVTLHCFILIWATTSTYLAAAAESFSSKIDAVTLYSSGALVNRTANLRLSGGEQTVNITGFPANLEPGSFRVEFDNKAVQVGQISTRDVIFRDTQDQDVAALEQQIKAVKQKIRIQNDLAKSANLQLKLLDSLATGYGKDASARLTQGQGSASGWQQALNLMQSGSTKAYETLRQTDDELVELNKELAVLNAKLNNERSAAKKSTTIVLVVSSSNALSTTAKIQYAQEDAEWEPAYEARLDTATGRLVVAQKAIVQQSTSEPWPDIELTLSTSEPDEETQVPMVNSEFFTLVDPRPVPRQLSRAAAPRASAVEDEFEEVVVMAASNEPSWSGSYALSFPVPGRVSVSNDRDQTQRYDLQRFEFDSQLITQIAPTKSSNAFLAARFTYQGSVPLYGSDMLVFVDGTFSGTSDMPSILPGKEITMPMGQDPRIEVRTIDLAAKNDEAGVFKKLNVVAHDDVFEIINRRPNAAEIEVKAAFPVSKHKSLKINIGDDTTPPTEENADDLKGIAVWRKRVEPNETWKIRRQYTITYPSDQILRSTY